MPVIITAMSIVFYFIFNFFGFSNSFYLVGKCGWIHLLRPTDIFQPFSKISGKKGSFSSTDSQNQVREKKKTVAILMHLFITEFV